MKTSATLRGLSRSLQKHEDVVSIRTHNGLAGDEILVTISGAATSAPIPASVDGIPVFVRTGLGVVLGRPPLALSVLGFMAAFTGAAYMAVAGGVFTGGNGASSGQAAFVLLAFSPILAPWVAILLWEAIGEVRSILARRR